MPSRRMLICAPIFAIASVSCSSLSPLESVPSKPQPEASATPCSAHLPYPTNDPNEMPVTLKIMYDLYGECAGLKYEQYQFRMNQGEE